MRFFALGFAPYNFARLGLLGFALLSCACVAHAAPFISLGDPPKYRDTSTFKAFDYTNPNAKKGGTLKAYALGSFSTLNAFSLEESAAGLELVYDTLMAQSMDEPYAQYALVASDVAIAPNHKSVIFTINPKARFSDGVAISAQDVGFSFDMMRQNPLYKQYYADISGYEILDSRRIKFLFTTSENKELPLILGQLSILPKHYYVRDGQNSYGKDPLQLPLGSGAYKLTRYEVGKLVEYRRDNYGQRIYLAARGSLILMWCAMSITAMIRRLCRAFCGINTTSALRARQRYGQMDIGRARTLPLASLRSPIACQAVCRAFLSICAKLPLMIRLCAAR